jgi:hypothetical protein
MKSKLTLGIICCTMLTFLTPSILNAQTKNYGTNRQPRACASRLEPRTGPLSVDQAKKYVACDNEGLNKAVIHSGYDMDFIDILSLQVAPKSRRVTIRDMQDFLGIDAEKPAYDIRGSIVKYSCDPIGLKTGNVNACRKAAECVTKILLVTGTAILAVLELKGLNMTYRLLIKSYSVSHHFLFLLFLAVPKVSAQPNY